jgi:hypothetical protein
MPETSVSPTTAYIVRCAAGMPTAPAFYPAGKFLGWVGGWFIPCRYDELVKRYQTRKVAADVAERAEQAFPGARFEVEEVKGVLPC